MYSPLTTEVRATKKYSVDGLPKTRHIVHNVASTSLSSAINELITLPNQKSVNYIIHDDTIISSVPEEYRSWTSSNRNYDAVAVTYEIVNSTGNPKWEISQKSFNTVAKLIAEISDRLKMPDLTRGWRYGGVIGHREVPSANTDCPGPYLFPLLGSLTELAQSLRGTKLPSTSPIPPFPLPLYWYFGPKEGPRQSVSGYYSYRNELKVWQTEAKRKAYYTGNIDGLYGPLTKAAAVSVQTKYKLKIDGLIGKDTWPAVWYA